MNRHAQADAKEINAGGFDVLFANSCQFFAASPIARHVRIPAVLYLQEPLRSLYEAQPDPAFIAPLPPVRSVFAPWYIRSRLHDYWTTGPRRRQIRYEHENARAFGRILVNSYFSRESVLRTYGLDATVCYLGIDTNRFPFADLNRHDYVVGIGALRPAKNIEFVIHALAQTQKPHPELIWIGNVKDDRYVADLSQLAERLGVPFTPKVMVPDSELIHLLQTARALVYSPRLEPFGYVPLEANACGTPAIGIAEGGVRETIQDGVNGFLVDARPQALAEAVDRLRYEPELARRLGHEGRAWVEKRWSLDGATTRLESNLTELAIKHDAN